MIITQLNGGLGNQLFQYAIARKLAIDNNTNVLLDVSLYDTYKLRNFSLEPFSFNQEKANEFQLKIFNEGKINSRIEHFFYKIIRKVYKPVSIIETTLEFQHSVAELKYSNVYLQGYWQSEKYFIDIRKQLLEDFKIKNSLSGINLELSEKIIKSNSISVHIRRGDYVTNVHNLSVHGICGLDYYEKGIEYLTKNVSNPELFVFSDDMEWVRENLKVNIPITYVDNNDALTDYEDLRLMSQCKHNIIANSSFSWWGAWLNTNINKLVIAPKNWFVDQSLNAKDIIPTSWIKM